jgi:serralysin
VSEENESHYCMLLMPKRAEGTSRAALLDEFKWQLGTVVRARFVEGDAELRERVQAVAQEWTGPQMANATLQFTNSDDADIRIGFQQGQGSWSYIGTACQEIGVSELTMNYGWLTSDSPDHEVRSVVLHEFGHALGLIHEHQNPQRPISWNRAAVIADLSGPPNNWDLETIENNMFKRYEPGEVTGTDTDPLSIMMYPIPRSWTTDGFSAGFNGELSETDKALIKKCYPW